MIRIDGAFGEGGGQILRTSLSLALVTGQAFRIENIRAGRERPGLLRQHLTAVRAAAEIGSAKVEGAELGSTALTFLPGTVRPGNYTFSVGTAGSGTLVLHTVLPALILASEPSRLTIEGGTHNQAAPPFEFLARTFLPLVERMGPRVSVKLERYGFYPAGGGRFSAEIEPVAKLSGFELGERGDITKRRVEAWVANLQHHIAERESVTAARLLNWDLTTERAAYTTRDSIGPGNVLLIEVSSAEITEVFSGFGRLGVSAERVASDTACEVRDYLACRAVAGEHLTDQLLLPLALAGQGSFTAQKINMHAQTNMDVIQKFLQVRFDTTESAECRRVEVSKR